MSFLLSIVIFFVAGMPVNQETSEVRQHSTGTLKVHVHFADTLESHMPSADTLEVHTPAADTLEAVPAGRDTLDADIPDAYTLATDDPVNDTLGVDRPDPDLSPEAMPQTDERDPIIQHDPVVPLKMRTPQPFNEITNDSLSRWQLWSDQGEWLTRRPGVISFQLGGLGRNDGFLIRGHESRHQRIYRDGIPVNERIFGSANRKRLPHYSRIGSVQEFASTTRYHTEMNTVRYHVSRPLTFINYEQTIYDYRSTEGFLTRNITPSTNISLAYWGKNEAEGYRNNTMGGRNASVTMYHYLSDSWILEGGFHYSGLQLGEPDGYQPYDMLNFLFDRFEAIPNQPLARSSVRSSLLHATAYHRKSENHEATSRISIYHDRYRRLHYDSSDSSFVRTLSTGISGRHFLVAGPFELQGDIYSEWSLINRDRFQTMDIDSWFYSEARGMLTLPLPNRSRLYSWLQSGWRTDGYTDSEIGAGINWRLFRGMALYGSYSIGDQMPRPGHLYRTHLPVRGNPELDNEVLQRGVAGVKWLTGSWDLGVELHATHHRNPILVGTDSVFAQPDPYTTAGATSWLGYDGNRLEFSLSGTFLQYFSEGSALESQLLDRSGQRMWARVSGYYKNYIYNSAAFMKAGFHIQASPTLYRSAQYYPALDYWDPNSWSPIPEFTEAQALPEFVRLDLDLTVRVRSAIFLFRLENALDNWLLPGYFETAWKPMPPSRLRFGIRWVLRN